MAVEPCGDDGVQDSPAQKMQLAVRLLAVPVGIVPTLIDTEEYASQPISGMSDSGALIGVHRKGMHDWVVYSIGEQRAAVCLVGHLVLHRFDGWTLGEEVL
jgi:hypothetical protein